MGSSNFTPEEAAELRRRRIRRREHAAKEMLRVACCGDRPNTPELTDEQLLPHARTILDRARVIYEVWKHCEGTIPQPISTACMELRTAITGAAETWPPETDENHHHHHDRIGTPYHPEVTT